MSSFQRTIKYIAIGLAIFLAVVIISGIANAAFAIVSGISGGIRYHSEKDVDYTNTFTGVTSLDIDNSTGKFIIRTGDAFKIEAENVYEDFVAKVNDNGTLTISDNENGLGFLWFDFHGFRNPNSKITLYLPEDFIAEKADIHFGAGTVTLEGLHTKKLDISAGAGNINGADISAEEAKIEGGVGNVILKDVNLAYADIDCGIGNMDIEGVLLGKNIVECGIGEVDIDLTGSMDDYDLSVDSGIGTIRLNGEKIHDGYKTDNKAPSSIKIEGGIGNVRIEIRD